MEGPSYLKVQPEFIFPASYSLKNISAIQEKNLNFQKEAQKEAQRSEEKNRGTELLEVQPLIAFGQILKVGASNEDNDSLKKGDYVISIIKEGSLLQKLSDQSPSHQDIHDSNCSLQLLPDPQDFSMKLLPNLSLPVNKDKFLLSPGSLALIEPSLMTYQALFVQGHANKENTQLALVLDSCANLEAIVAIQLLQKKAGVRFLACQVETFEQQKQIMEQMSGMGSVISCVNTQNDDLLTKSMELTNGMGFDLIVDFGGRFFSQRRQMLKLLSLFGRVITMPGPENIMQMQLDPPECMILHQLQASLIFVQKNMIILSGMHDGIIKSALADIIELIEKGDVKMLVYPGSPVEVQLKTVREIIKNGIGWQTNSSYTVLNLQKQSSSPLKGFKYE